MYFKLIKRSPMKPRGIGTFYEADLKLQVKIRERGLLEEISLDKSIGV
jgi:hypothetical protein